MEDANLSNRTNLHVFFDIKFGDAKAGRVVIELFKDKVPKTVENFRALCTGEKGIGKFGKPLCYKGTIFHRVIPICIVQGGDIVNNDGTSGESIYGEKFDDECLELEHKTEGLVGMSNSGPNTNQSQFYITTVLCSHLDGTNVIVGKVVKGLNIIVEMANIPRESDKPLEPIMIEDCGEFKPGESWNICENDGTLDVYPPWPDDWCIDSVDNYRIIKKTIEAIKDSGNYFYKNHNYIDSERKYVKTLRYIDWYICHKKENSKLMEDTRTYSLLNLAAVKLKREKYKDVLELCSQVLKKDPHCVKAYYRRGHARLCLKDYDKALDDLQTAVSYHPKDKNILQLLKVVKERKLVYLRKEKRAFSKLFQ
ncbi:peptidyl-prolyl cis-trans isomerase D [Anoplophora glabripennis]|uniref:peptidyl-prolyl cis-trans isomerase D n=1 Tax=Anoplophora glabripennis TaxID=217634 RepID=UPI000874EB94|nr:peptidyl-prolyl cis-trans isomerase D [Anoplophora glabripennis]